MRDLEGVVAVLQQHHQRATYGAVAGVVGGTAQSVMGNRAREPRYSWVVNSKTKLPTGYARAECHPMLTRRSHMIDDPHELYHWLRAPK